MNAGDGRSESKGLSPEAAFSLVANDVRIDVLRTLARIERRASARSTATFSEIFHEVAVEDSGLFNYHLEKLTGHFVEKTEAGYQLRHAGRKVVHTIVEGAFTERKTLGPFEVDGTCHECGEQLSAFYEHGWMAVECRECGEFGVYDSFPPQGVNDREPEAIMRTFDAHVRSKIGLISAGVCPECRGPMHSSILSGSPDHWSYDGFEMIAHHRCQRCENQMWPAVGLHLIAHPAVRSFHFDLGIDHREVRFWNFQFAVTHHLAEIRSKNPWRVEVRVPADGDELHVILDGDLAVRETEIV